jgi:hypothetical protein
MAKHITLRGTKIVEVPYFTEQLIDNTKSVLVIGERHGGVEGVSESIHELGFKNVCTTDILDSPVDSWLRNNTSWNHITCDFIKFDESNKFDYIVSISVFEHFGFWFAGGRMADGLSEDDTCYWNHDIRGIQKACKLLKDSDSKLIITLPAGPYMNYEESGEPFLRYYDHRRQQLIKNILNESGFAITNERFFYSADFSNWEEMSYEINDPKYYSVYNLYTPNVIWGLTIQQI